MKKNPLKLLLVEVSRTYTYELSRRPNVFKISTIHLFCGKELAGQ